MFRMPSISLYLSDVGKIELNQTATKEEIFECLDFYREM
jgi:hypothetical protein